MGDNSNSNYNQESIDTSTSHHKVTINSLF